MKVAARAATADDLERLVALYNRLAAEQETLKPAWLLADALPAAAAESLQEAIADPKAWLLVGTIDDHIFGFLLARSEELLPQAGPTRAAAIRLIFTDPEVREVGVGHAMIAAADAMFAAAGHGFVDAHVLPGHRLAKNFFEAHGFAARSIVMHRSTEE